MNEMRKLKPKQFWKRFKKNKGDNSENISMNDFLNISKILPPLIRKPISI